LAVRNNPVNLSSPILALNQILSSFKEEKLFSAVGTEIGNATTILRKYVCIG
jgi:hypothetical protein